MVIKSWWDVLLHGDIFAYLSLSACVPHSLRWVRVRATALHVKAMVQTEKTKTSPGKKDWIWAGSKGQSDDDTGIEDCYGREKLEVKIWLGKNKDGSQEQNIYGPVGQKVCVEEQHRCDLMCRSEEGKEWLGKELWTKEEQGVDKYLMEDRYLTGIKVQTETWDGLERKSEIKGYTVNEPGVWGGSLREEISRKAMYWQGGEREHGQTQG